MKIKVTAEHIKRGRTLHSHDCAVALAINELLKNCYYSVVGHTDFAIYKRSQNNQVPDEQLFRLNGYVKTGIPAFINKWDRKEAVSPTVFELNLPINLLK